MSFDGAGSSAYDLNNWNVEPEHDLPNAQLFYKYAAEFPCLKGEQVSLNTVSAFKMKLMADDDDAHQTSKELAIDCILELLSGGDYEITWKDIFDVFSKEDQEAFIRVMVAHSTRHV